MKRGSESHGYTIVEVLIVLAVTGALLVAVMVIISGQQGRTEFSQSVNDIQAQINDVINNVAAGYYTNTGNFNCQKDPVSGAPVLDNTQPFRGQGTNSDCTYLGQALQLAVAGDSTAYNVYNIIGVRQAGGVEATSLSQAKPIAMVQNGVDTTDSRNLQYGLKAVKMKAGATDIGIVAFTSSFSTYSGCVNLCSGSQNVELHPINTTTLGQDKSGGIAAINAQNANAQNFLPAPNGGVTICFESGGSNQNGTITIGGSGRQLSTSLVITNGSCP